MVNSSIMVLGQGFILLLQKSWSAGGYGFCPVTVGNSYTHGGFYLANFNGVFPPSKISVESWALSDLSNLNVEFECGLFMICSGSECCELGQLLSRIIVNQF